MISTKTMCIIEELLCTRSDTLQNEPLAYRMRPQTIDEIAGQEEIIGKKTALYKLIKNGHVPSMLLIR